MKHPFIVAITGASGAAYARRLLQVLVDGGHLVHLTISPSGAQVIQQELGLSIDVANTTADSLLDAFKIPVGATSGRVEYHRFDNYMSPIASGSSITAGMVVCPCSGSTLSGVAHGASTNLIQRAADVHLKEGRPLILVPRETPISLVQIENMKLACQAGAVILPASPGWYHNVESLQDLIDFVVARVLDQLRVEHSLMRRWGE